MLSTGHSYADSYAKGRAAIMNQGSIVFQKVEKILYAEAQSPVKDVTKLYVGTVYGICQIIADRDAMNGSADDLPPVLPHKLAALESSDLCATRRRHRERLLMRWTTTEIGTIGQQHQELVAAYVREQPL